MSSIEQLRRLGVIRSNVLVGDLGELVAANFYLGPTSARPHAVVHPLDVYARAAPDHRELATALSPIISDRLTALCERAAQQAATETDLELLLEDTTLAAALTRLLAGMDVTPDALRTAVNVMPERADLVLTPLALALTARLADRYRRLAAANAAAYEPDLASSLNNLSVDLGEVGRRDEAERARMEAVERLGPT